VLRGFRQSMGETRMIETKLFREWVPSTSAWNGY
jgi:hypothetical protein